MNKLLVTLSAVILLLAGATLAHAGKEGRMCYGPVVLNTVSNYGPDTTGIDLTAFDGDMTVHVWKANSAAISVQIQGTQFTSAEDSTGDSFKIHNTLTTTDVLTLKGPLERLRFYLATCGSGTDCLVKAKVCGRVSK